MLKYIFSIVFALALTFGAPVSAAPVVQPAPVEVQGGPGGCDFVQNALDEVAKMTVDQEAELVLVLCKIAPAPRDDVGHYIAEITFKEKGKRVGYGWMYGKIQMKAGDWQMASAPDLLFGMDYFPTPDEVSP